MSDINDSKAKIIHKKIMNMIALDNHPFTLTEDQGFIELVAHLQPKYLISSRKYFTETMQPTSCKLIQDAVLKDLSEAKYLSLHQTYGAINMLMKHSFPSLLIG